jgi:hypothetical protein
MNGKKAAGVYCTCNECEEAAELSIRSAGAFFAYK